jgi:branched-subunit amino acid aminotransferase/4-amino-4-deoxychorismate lyase
MNVAGDRVWLNGRVVPVADATVSLLDRGLQFGEGLFDTVRVYGGVPFRLSTHIERLREGCRGLALPVPDAAALAAAVAEYLDACGAVEARLRLVVTPGPPGGPATTALLAQPAIRPESPAVCVVAPPRLMLEGMGAHKLLARVEYRVARDAAEAAGADEALLTTPGGHLLEGTRSNVFLVRDGTLCTPPADGSILVGVTRGVMLELAEAEGIAVDESPLPVAALDGAAEVFLTGSVAEVRPVAEVRGRFQAAGALPGPVTARLQRGFAACVDRECRTPAS